MKEYNQVLSSIMREKSFFLAKMLNIPGEWYFMEDDHEEIMSWTPDEAKDIWNKIEKRILKHQASGLNYELCPFCYKEDYNHAITVSKRHNPSCVNCGYGKRHGICISRQTGDKESQFQKILCAFKSEGINVYKTLSNGHYKKLIEKLSVEMLMDVIHKKSS